MADLIKGVPGEVYTPEQSSSLYPTAGDTTDWTYGTYGIPSYTIELRPNAVADGGFIPTPRPDPAHLGGKPRYRAGIHCSNAVRTITRE